mgnify:CR=1 FL=1
MPIKSYLAHPHENQKETLVAELSSLDNCEVIPAENKDVLILVTETKDKTEEANLKDQLDTIKSLKLLAMVSGFNSPKN